jgi:hypothetical protein
MSRKAGEPSGFIDPKHFDPKHFDLKHFNPKT